MFPPTYISCDYYCVTFVSLSINLPHPRDFTSHTSRRGTLYVYMCVFHHTQLCGTLRLYSEHSKRYTFVCRDIASVVSIAPTSKGRGCNYRCLTRRCKRQLPDAIRKARAGPGNSCNEGDHERGRHGGQACRVGGGRGKGYVD